MCYPHMCSNANRLLLKIHHRGQRHTSYKKEAINQVTFKNRSDQMSTEVGLNILVETFHYLCSRPKTSEQSICGFIHGCVCKVQLLENRSPCSYGAGFLLKLSNVTFSK